MTRRYQQLLTLVMFFILGTVASVTFAHENQYVDNLALQIQQQANRVKAETLRFRQVPQYHQVVGNLSQIEHLARHIQTMARHTANLRHVKYDLRRLDTLVHQTEDLFRQMERAALHGHGQLHGCIHRAYRLLHSMEDSVHQIQIVVERLNQNCSQCWTNQRQQYQPFPGQSIGFGGFGLDRNGMVIRNGRLGFNFSF